MIFALLCGALGCGRYGFDGRGAPADGGDGGGDGLDALVPYATPALVQEQDVDLGSASTLTAVSISPTGSGNLLVVGVVDYAPRAAVTSITDDAGNTYASAGAQSTNATGETEVWFAANTHAGATTLDIQVAASSYVVVWVLETSGLDPTSPLAGAATANDGTSVDPLGAPQVMPTTPNALIVSVLDITNPAQPDPDSPFIDLAFRNYDNTAYYVATGSGAYGAVWHGQPGSLYSASTVAFKAASH